jgi:hypothetical protein
VFDGATPGETGAAFPHQYVTVHHPDAASGTRVIPE